MCIFCISWKSLGIVQNALVYNNYSKQLRKPIQMPIDIKTNVAMQQYINIQFTIVDEFIFACKHQ